MLSNLARSALRASGPGHFSAHVLGQRALCTPWPGRRPLGGCQHAFSPTLQRFANTLQTTEKLGKRVRVDFLSKKIRGARHATTSTPPTSGRASQTPDMLSSAPPSPSPEKKVKKPFDAKAWVQEHWTGIGLSGVTMVAGFAAADALGQALMAAQGLSGGASVISGVPVAIILGLGMRNMGLVQPHFLPGLKFCTTFLLRAGIVCVGVKLSMYDLVALGSAGIPVVMASIGTGLFCVVQINRMLGLAPRLGLLTAAGTSICGVTAIVSLAPVIRATEQEVAYAVANIVAFGLIGMLAYPYLAHHLLDTSEQIGLFLGTAIHDTSQVIGAAMTYKEMYGDDVVLKVAAVTKLTRNLFLAAVIPGLAYLNATAAGPVKTPFSTLFPTFIFGFLAMSAIRTLGDYTLVEHGLALGVLDTKDWAALTKGIADTGGKMFLGTAMAAVGLSTSFSVFKGVGLMPFAVGLSGAVIVGVVGFTGAVFFGPYIKLDQKDDSLGALEEDAPTA